MYRYDQVLRGPMGLGAAGRRWPLAASWATRDPISLARSKPHGEGRGDRRRCGGQVAVAEQQ
jgi:hypothetical protein